MRTERTVLVVAAMSVLSVLGSTQSALAGDRYEPDNSRSAYGNIAVGQVQNHTIDPVGDVDWTRFYVPVTSYSASYYVMITNTGTTTLNVVQWIKAGLLPEFQWTYATPISPGKSVVAYANGVKSGTLWLKFNVYQPSRSKGSYTIKVVRYK